MASSPALDTTRNLVGFLILLKRLLILPVPTLAAINGHAFAGGAMLAFAHDLRTMNAEKGWICLNEVFNSFRFTMSMLILLESRLGKENCGDALVMGKRYTAQDALNSNMVHAIQPQRLLLQESIRVLKSHSGKGYPRESLRTMKEDINREILDHFKKNKIEELYEQKELPGDLSLISRL